MLGAGSSELATHLQTHFAFLGSVCTNERDLLEMREWGNGLPTGACLALKGGTAGVNKEGISSGPNGRKEPGVGSQQRLKHPPDPSIDQTPLQ